MTMESRQPEETGSHTDHIRSAALSTPDLWNEVLARLNEVQEGQLRLARAIESLGMIVCDALSLNPQAALGGGEAAALPRTPPRVSLGAGPAAPTEQLASAAQDLAATQRKVDSLLGADVFAPPPPTPEATTAAAPTSPRFYVAPVPEETRTAAREPVTSGSWPRGRRVARGLAREAPTMSTPAVVPNLTPAAIDALLAAEFGDVPSTPGPALRVVPATEGTALLNTLLGDEFGIGTAAPPSPGASPRPSPLAAPPPPTVPLGRPSPPTAPSSRPAPPPPMSAAAPMPAPVPQSPAPSAPSPMTPSPRPPVAAPSSPSWSPSVDPRRSAGAPPSNAPPPPPPPPPPPAVPRATPAAGTAPLLPPPVAAPPHQTVPGGPGSLAGPDRAFGTGPSAGPPVGPVTAGPAPFGSAPTPPTEEDPLEAISFTSPGAPPPPPPAVDETVDPTKPRDSAASMATEILSAAPRVPVVEQKENTPTMMAEDVTIMAKGRRRRFRLR